MSGLRTICSRCASHIRMTQALRLANVASFASLSEAAPSISSPTPQDDEKEDGASMRPRVGSSRGNYRKNFTHRSGRRPYRSSEDSAIALFNDVVKPPSAPQPFLGELEISARLKELTERNMAVADKLQALQTDIWPHLGMYRGHMPKHLLISTTQFLEKVCDDMARVGYTDNSVKFSRIYSSVGKQDLDFRNQLVLNICHAILHPQEGGVDRDVLVRELIGMWKHISQLRRKSQELQGLKFALPLVDDVFWDIEYGQPTPHLHHTTRALASLFLQSSPEQAGKIIPGLLATVAVLLDTELVKPNAQILAAPLLNLVAAVIGKTGADEAYVSSVFDDGIRFIPAKLSDIKTYVVQHWDSAKEMLSKEDAIWRRGLKPMPTSRRSEHSGLAFFHRQLQVAYASRVTGAILSVWKDLKVRLERQPALGRQIHNDPEFLDFCIYVWCAVRRSTELQETLDLMQKLGVHPTIKSYTAMMHGWKICKDTDRIELLWSKLASSGVKFDVVIWTERISALIEGGKPQAGIQALAEMMARWNQAIQKNAPHTAVQPSVEVINAAVKGLIRLDRKAAFDVLEWAGKENIEPNIRTYNILLQEGFRENTPDDVQSLLNSMSKQGIEPDAATFTIILEEVLGSMGNDSAADQILAIQQVLDDIKAAGLQPNPETYGKMLYAVSSLANGADEAIDAVQMYMRENGFKITPHMVTILIERAISRNPPDINAINALLRKHNYTHVSQGDQTLWERVMSAHAIAGDTSRAMSIFDDLADGGRPVTSLPCLTELLMALLEKGQREEAQKVVDIVLKLRTQEAKRSEETRYWKHHFWYLADDNRLLDWGEVPEILRAKLRGY